VPLKPKNSRISAGSIHIGIRLSPSNSCMAWSEIGAGML
jgi:hypothetical protein